MARKARDGSDASDDVDFDEGVAGDAAGGCDGCAHGRFGAEAAEEGLVHFLVVLEVVEVDIALEDFVHGRAAGVEALFDFIEDVLGVGLDVAFEVRADSGDEDEVAVGDNAVEERSLS